MCWQLQPQGTGKQPSLGGGGGCTRHSVYPKLCPPKMEPLMLQPRPLEVGPFRSQLESGHKQRGDKRRGEARAESQPVGPVESPGTAFSGQGPWQGAEPLRMPVSSHLKCPARSSRTGWAGVGASLEMASGPRAGRGSCRTEAECDQGQGGQERAGIYALGLPGSRWTAVLHLSSFLTGHFSPWTVHVLPVSRGCDRPWRLGDHEEG